MTTTGAEVGGLRREVGRVGMLAASLGAVIGSGWLFAPMAAASTAGPASVVSWLLGGCMVTLIALLVGELGSAYPVAGYVIRCPSLAFGPVIGFIAGWVSWLATTAGIAIMVTVCLIYFNAQVDGFATTSGAAPLLTLLGVLVAVVIIALFTVVNLLGVKLTTRINIFVVAVKIAIPVALVIGLLTTSFNGNNFIEFAPFGVQGVVEALPLGVVFSLLGFDQAVNLAGEARNPGRAIPRTVLGAVGITTGLYVLLQIAFIGALPAGSTAGGWAAAGSGDNATFVTFTAVLGLTGLAAVVYVNALISPVETGFVLSLAAPRLLYALSTSRALPTVFRQLNARGAPVVGVVVTAIASIVVLAPYAGWQQLTSFLTAGAVLALSLVPVSFTVLRTADPDRIRPYRVRAAKVLAPLTFACTALLFHWTRWDTAVRMIAAIALGMVLLLATRKLSGVDLPGDSWRAAVWFWPYLGGLALLGYLGPFGGAGILTFWWDMLAVIVFSLIIYRIAVVCGRSAARVAEVIDSDQELAPANAGG